MSSHNPLTPHSPRELSTHPPSKDVSGSQKDLTRSAFSKEFKPENLSRTVEAQGKEHTSRPERFQYSPQTEDTFTDANRSFNPNFSKHLQQARTNVINAEKNLRTAKTEDLQRTQDTLQIARDIQKTLEAHAAKYYPGLISPEPPQAGVFPHDTVWTTMRRQEIIAH